MEVQEFHLVDPCSSVFICGLNDVLFGGVMRDDGNGSAAIMQHHPAGDVPTEDARLDDAIRKADELLLSSLKSEEHSRSRRRRTFTFTIVGGLIMFAAACVIVAILAQTNGGATAPAASG